MKLLITGGCGFLGSNLSINAINRDDELVVFDNLHRKGSLYNLQWLMEQGTFRFVHGDIRNQNDITSLVQEFKPDAIFHLAGQVAMTTSIANPRMDFEINVIGTYNLLEAVRRYASEAVVLYSSTNKVYGNLEQYRYHETDTRYNCIDKPAGFDEGTLLEFHSPYGCSKGAADQYMLDYARIFGIKTVVFRHSSMYGEQQFATYDQGWIGWFIKEALRIKKDGKGKIEIHGNGKQVRDILYVEDMINLYSMTFEKIDKCAGEAFNIGGGMKNSISLIELLRYLENKLSIEIELIKKEWRLSDQKVFVADIKKITKTIGWEPQVSKDNGLDKMIGWSKKC
jgi:CDP-paratose 2-epimerase